MNLARFSVARPVTAGIISVALFVLGMFYLLKMPVSLYPDVSIPFISVTVPYPGASPEQIESAIVKPIEAEVAGLKKISRVIGVARPGFGQLILGFKMSADEQEAADAVREKIAIVKGKFPQGAKEPIVARVDVGATPILIYGVETDKTADVTQQLLDDGLLADLRRTDGVNEARLVGLGEERVQLTLDARRLSDLRVAPLDIFDQLSAKMAIIPWGDVTQNDEVLSVSRSLLPADLKYWEEQRVTLRDGRSVTLGEVGTIKIVRDESASSVFINGKRGLGLVVTKRADANTLATVKAVQKTLGKVAIPTGISLFSILDQSSFIEENSKEVWIALFAGGFFAVLVILFFLTDWRSALISATALPVSIAGSFIFMSWLDFSVNMMSLLAMALAIGLLIDDAVVVREAIYTEMEKGASPKEAAVRGTDRVAAAVIATSLAVIAVFLPVAGMDGMVGQFFKQFGVTICIAVAISTWVAFTLDPMLSAYFAGHPRPFQGAFWVRWRAWLENLEERISNWAVASFKRPKFVLLMSLLALVLAVGLSLSRGADFLAFEDRGQFIVNIRTQAGTTREHNEKVAQDALKRIQDFEGLQEVFVTVGELGDANLIQVRLVFVAKTKRKTGLLEMQKMARERLKDIDGQVLVMDPPPIEGIGGEAPLSVYVYGEDLQKTREVSEQLLEKIRALPGIASARLETSAFAKGVDVSFKPQDLGFAGSASQAVELTGRLALTGLEAGTVGDKNIPFYLRLDDKDRNINTLWSQVFVPSMRGPMPLSQFAEISETSRPRGIDREKRSRKMVIWGTLDRTQTFGVVLASVQKLVDEIPKPFSGEIQGDKEVFEEMVGSFTLAIVGSLFFIFIILAAQFENLLRPFVILLSLPLAVIGGFVALFLVGQQLALGALIGMVFLIGLAAKNGILLVDAIGVKEKSMPMLQAVRESVRERSRAILMTSIAMIFGMIPTAVMRGGGSEFRSPMAIAIIGGVISSTVLSFFVVPAVFGLIDNFRRRRIPLPTTTELSTATRTGLMFLAILAGSVGVLEARASGTGESVAKAPETPRSSLASQSADMAKVISLIGKLKSDGPEAAQIQGAERAASEASRTAVESVFGGARLEYGREWYNPGVSQNITLPGPTGPISLNTVVVPKEQRVTSIGWQIPVLNTQVVYGWIMRSALHNQADKIREAQFESGTLGAAQLLLQTELAVQTARVNQGFVEISKARETIVRQRLAAGLSTRLELSQAEAGTLGAVAQWEQAKAEETRIRQQFMQQVGQPFPEAGVGLPQFPFNSEKPFRSTGLEALRAIHEVQVKNSELSDASFYPTISLEMGYSDKSFETSPAPQKFAAVKARWDILDGGARTAMRGRNMQVAFDALAKVRQTENQLRSSYDTLKTRHEAFQRAKSAAEFGQRAAAAAQQQAMQAYSAGLARAFDVRTADEAKLKADFALIQLQFALQGLALEALALTGEWNNFLRNFPQR
jgi:HAE1 family hydrophobic/amphiphilic exporter-1